MPQYQLPNGSQLAISKALATPLDIVSATNAAECVIVLKDVTGLAKGDPILMVKSGWLALQNSVQFIKQVDTVGKSITLFKCDTTDTTDFPAGGMAPVSSGAGGATISYQIAKVDGWAALPYTTSVNVSGGESQQTSFQPIQVDKAIPLNTTKTATTQAFTFTHDAEDPIYPLLEKADKRQTFCAFQFFNPRARGGKGEYRVYGCQVSFNKIPTSEVNSVETVVVTLSLASDMAFFEGDAVKALATAP